MKRKIMLSVIAIVLVAAISVCGTLAILKQSTGPVTNTFTASPGIVNTMTLNESQANYTAGTGLYTLNTSTKVTSNTYDKVVPNTDIPKDPTLTVDVMADALVYVFVEVNSSLDSHLTYTIDSAWTQLAGVTGPNGGNVYTLASGTVQGTSATNEVSQGILANNKIVAGDFGSTSSLGEIKFFGYVCQAQGSADASTAWTAASFTAYSPEP